MKLLHVNEGSTDVIQKRVFRIQELPASWDFLNTISVNFAVIFLNNKKNLVIDRFEFEIS